MTRAQNNRDEGNTPLVNQDNDSGVRFTATTAAATLSNLEKNRAHGEVQEHDHPGVDVANHPLLPGCDKGNHSRNLEGYERKTEQDETFWPSVRGNAARSSFDSHAKSPQNEGILPNQRGYEMTGIPGPIIVKRSSRDGFRDIYDLMQTSTESTLTGDNENILISGANENFSNIGRLQEIDFKRPDVILEKGGCPLGSYSPAREHINEGQTEDCAWPGILEREGDVRDLVHEGSIEDLVREGRQRIDNLVEEGRRSISELVEDSRRNNLIKESKRNRRQYNKYSEGTAWTVVSPQSDTTLPSPRESQVGVSGYIFPVHRKEQEVIYFEKEGQGSLFHSPLYEDTVIHVDGRIGHHESSISR